MFSELTHDLTSGLLVAAVLASAPAHSDPLTLACGQSEAAALGHAPTGVRRISKDRLRIQWAQGTQFFVNVGVEPGMLDGVGYQYCGFTQGYHLIGKSDNGLFTGVLLDAADGRILPAGHTVKFAPDGERYFAAQQPDGLDGEEWIVYSVNGTPRWAGVSGITARGEWEYYLATFEGPRWSMAGELEATIRCARDTTKTGTVTLRAADGQYRWVSTIECRRE